MHKRFPALAVTLAVIAVAIAPASQAVAGSAIPVAGAYFVSDFGTTTCVSVGASGFKGTLHPVKGDCWGGYIR